METNQILFICFKYALVIFSGAAACLSLLFMLSPNSFRVLEEMMGLEIGWETTVTTVLEGRINILNDWVYKNHVFFGPLLAILAAWNTRSVFFM
jgi:hypothetical protein